MSDCPGRNKGAAGEVSGGRLVTVTCEGRVKEGGGCGRVSGVEGGPAIRGGQG